MEKGLPWLGITTSWHESSVRGIVLARLANGGNVTMMQSTLNGGCDCMD